MKMSQFQAGIKK